MDIISANNGILNGALGNVFQVTLASATTMNFQNFDLGTEFEVIVKQDSSGSQFAVTWPAGVTWQAGASPNLTASANGVDVFKFVCTSVASNTFRDTGGAPSRTPSKFASAALGYVLALTTALGGYAISTIHLSNNLNATPGNFPAVLDIYAGTGASKLGNGAGSGTWLRQDDGSGSVKIGKFGGVGVGVADRTSRLDSVSNSGSWLPNGNFRTRGTMSGGTTLTLSPFGSSPTFKVLCPKAGGVIGTMTVTATGTVLKTCS